VEKVGGDLELQHVDFHYQMRPDNKVLKDLSLSIPRGKVCALVGKSGEPIAP
jgi:ABC-type multidrug transport system fused ATPase/permease subunit